MKTKTLFLLSVLCLFGKGKSSDAQKESSSQAVQATCVTTARDLAEAFAEVICPRDCLASSKSVWGTDVYTDDSSICKAAIHAGLLDNNGGVVVVMMIPGQASYSGSTKNGITTSSYGAWPGSFIFSIPMTTTTKTTVTQKPTVQATCSTKARDLTGTSAEVLCPRDCLTSRKRIWGTDVYTDDSYVCQAAIHAGLLDNNGGLVVVEKTPGQANYSGSTRNGITTSSYGAWPGSFILSASIPMTTTKTSTQKPTVQATCSTTANDLIGSSTEINCPQNCLTAGKMVWGTDVYTDDSFVCPAAIHAGLLDNSGGLVTVEKMSGQASYIGSTKNGITTFSYGAWSGSFKFTYASVQATCLTTARDLAGSSAKVYCPHDCLASEQRVWGTDVYTDDSHICQAAIHAGLLDANGGLVSIEKMPGQASYNGSTRNGITTSSYGGWPGSFVFTFKPMTTPKTLTTQKPSVQATCLTSARNMTASYAEFNCPPGCLASQWGVWGTDIYMDDSSVCKAAIHAGLLDDNGGVVSVKNMPGQAGYCGSTRNGINTYSDGTWSGSFMFSNGSMNTTPTAAANQNTTVRVVCSTPAKDITASPALIICPPECFNLKISVWGTDIYTDASAICPAAIHAGKMDNNGGVVTIQKTSGQDRYQGSSKNGITTESFGISPGSFIFC